MLFVRTELRPSSIHGVGTFLLEPVKKGQLIWRFDTRVDRTYTEAELNSLPDVCKELLDNYGCWDAAKRVWLLYGDEMRYINHSDDPVLQSIGGPFGESIATRDLAKDEEISVNYHLICDMTKSNGIL
jgi:SET domain-containing protein